ncbi:hypothetical protein H0H93_009070, partial [Arthromyces matolae]
PSSVCLSSPGKQAGPKCPDDVTSLFLKTIDGNDITLGLGQPRTLPNLAWFPKGWQQAWDLSTLGDIAKNISQQYKSIMGQVQKDEDEIWKAIAFVQGTALSRRPRRSVAERKVPQAHGGADLRRELIKMIQYSRTRVRKGIDARNTQLRLLSEITHSWDIANPHPPNVYVTFWKEHQIQLQPMAEADHLPESKYLFGKNCRGGDITKEIGLPKPMANVAPMPEGWKEFKPEELIDMANEISTRFPAIRRKVMDDTNAIRRAISALQRNASMQEITGSLKMYQLPKKALSAEDYRKELIAMIYQSWQDLEHKVVDRNTRLKKLDKLQVSLDDVGNADPTNIYVAYWKESHGLPLKPVSPTMESSPGVSNVQLTPNWKRPAQPGVPGESSSKRRTQPSSKPAHIDEETKVALQHGVPSSGSPNPSTPGNVQGHSDAGNQHVVGSPSHSSDLPATPWTASSTTAGPSNHIPIDPVLMTGQHWAGL